MENNNNYNPLFEMVFEEDMSKEGPLEDCKKFLQKTKGFKLFHMNVCSVRAKHNDLTALFNALKGDLDCIVLSEAHINTDRININQFSFDGYTAYCSQYNVRKTDGLAIYVKSSLEHSIEEIKAKDANCIHIKIVKNKKLFCCTTFYRSPNGVIDNFLTELTNILETKKQDNAYKIMTGDMNINLLDQKSMKVQKYLNIMSENGYMSLINKPTRVSNKSKTCIDHLFVDPQVNEAAESFILQSSTSDHYSTILSVEIKGENNVRETEYFSFSEINENKLEIEISKEKWEEVYNCEDPLSCINILENKIKKHIDNCTVIKIKKAKQKKCWVTEGILNSIKKRDKLHLLTKKEPFNKQAKEVYNKYRNKLNNIIKSTRNRYYREKIEEAQGNKRKIWSTVNEATKYKPGKTCEIKKIEIEGSLVDVESDTLRVANYFNECYTKVGGSNNKNLHQAVNSNRTPEHNQMSGFCQSHLYMKPITPDEIDSILSKQAGGTAPGHDKIQMRTLKVIKKYISKPLSGAFNLCLRNGVFPDQFKLAVISPIYKKGPKHLVQNYRPLSLLSSTSKLFERCIKTRLNKFLEENEILSDTQYGFRQERSTNDAIMKVIEGVYPVIDKGQKSAVVLMDLSRAFEMVDHKILLDILYRVGVRGMPYKLFESYLNGRSQRVKIYSYKTETSPREIKRTKTETLSLVKKKMSPSQSHKEPYSLPPCITSMSVPSVTWS